MKRVAILGVRTSCVWGVGLASLFVVAWSLTGFRSWWTLAVLTVFGVVNVLVGLSLAASRQARLGLRAWNHAWWSRRGRTPPPWCSYGRAFFTTVVAVFVIGGALMIAASALVAATRSGGTTVEFVDTPRLVGLTHDAAIARIIGAGMCPGWRDIEDGRKSGVVIAQSPAPGTRAVRYSQVAVTIGAAGPYAEITDGRGWPKECRS